MVLEIDLKMTPNMNVTMFTIDLKQIQNNLNNYQKWTLNLIEIDIENRH